MSKKVTTQLFILSMLVLLAVLPAAILAQEGGEAMEGEAMMTEVSCQQDYTVQRDDWLSKIAEKFYGDVLAFPAIAQATNTHYEAAIMAESDKVMLAEGDKAMAGEAMADEAMIADDKLMFVGADGQMMAAVMEADGRLMVQGTDGQMMEVKVGEDGHVMSADGSMVDGKLVLEDLDGQMMEVMMFDGKLMIKDVNGQIMEVAMADKAMASAAMAGEDAIMAEGKAMMAGNYALIETPDLIEPGWVLCIPSAREIT